MSKRNKKQTKFSHISEVLGSLIILNKKNKPKREISKIEEAWQKKIESPILENVHPHLFRKGVLTLKVSDSSWMNALQYLKEEIMEKLNSSLHKNIIKKVKFII